MKFDVSEHRLCLIADEEDKVMLAGVKADNPESFCSDSVLNDLMETIIANSELEWVMPEECNALTAAPILGICGSNGELLRVFGFMAYAVTSPQEQLLDFGHCIWEEG